MAIDVFQNYNRGIYDHTDRNDKTRERDHVERIGTEPQHHECRQERQRNADRDDHAGPGIGQEQENYENGENDRLDKALAHAANVDVDNGLLIVRNLKVDVRVLGLEFR